MSLTPFARVGRGAPGRGRGLVVVIANVQCAVDVARADQAVQHIVVRRAHDAFGIGVSEHKYCP
jgi:hypothetical protein